MAAMEVDGTVRAAADGDDLPGTSASVGGGSGGNDGRRGRTADGGRRTLTGKGRHVRNMEVDGTARARAAAGRRGLRSSRRRRQVRVDADGQGTRAGATKTAGEGGR